MNVVLICTCVCTSAGFGRPPPLKNRQKRVEKKTIENEYLSVGDNRGQSVVEDLNPFSRRSSGEEDKMPSQPPAAGGPLREKRVGVTNRYGTIVLNLHYSYDM